MLSREKLEALVQLTTPLFVGKTRLSIYQDPIIQSHCRLVHTVADTLYICQPMVGKHGHNLREELMGKWVGLRHEAHVNFIPEYFDNVSA